MKARKKKQKAGWVKQTEKIVKKNLTLLLGVLVVLFLLTTILLWTQKPSDAKTSDVASTEPEVVGPPRVLDNEISFGWDYRGDYSAHNFVCRTCCCDKSRKDFVYVSYGNIEFDLKAITNRTNILTITVGNLNENCRRNNVFIDGKLAGNLDKATSGPSKTEFMFNVTPVWDNIHVKIEHLANASLCWWGNDVLKARVDIA